MLIPLSAGTGHGPTTVSAFDAALLDAGVTHWNLVHLSSVVPPGSVIEERTVVTPPEEFGQRRYVVLAHHFAVDAGQQAWAGLGWCQDETGKGLFVEITGGSEQAVAEGIAQTLDSMKARRRFPLGPNRQKIIGVRCDGEPACALVVAVFPEAGPWPAHTIMNARETD